MIEQWFLDLDGVRSGPYQTPEVMSLVAEGEVLPHHRISTTLRDGRWETILDWRLDQAKLSQNFPNPNPFSSNRSEIFSVEGLEAETPAVEAAKAPPEIPAPIPELVHEVPPAVEEFKVELASVSTPELPKAPAKEVPPPAKGETRPKRDPMAEMFDMLQNSKQKRDAKPILVEPDQPTIQKSGGLLRTLMIGGGITLIGFALGQLFQQASPPKEAAPTQNKSQSSSLPSPTATPASPETALKVSAPRKIETAPLAGKGNPKSLHGANDIQNEKEIEELKNLKKELQELKALKNDSDGNSENGADGDGFDANPPDANNLGNPNNGIPTTNPAEGVPLQGPSPEYNR